jgi:hypothetical protein
MELLDSLQELLAGDEGISGLVDARIYKFKPLEKSEAFLNSGNRSMISCELQDWDGRNSITDPVFVVDIRSRKGENGGAEYCSEIVSAITELLRDGFGGVQVNKILGTVRHDKILVGYRCRLVIHGHISPSLSLTLAASLASPQAAGSTIVFVAATDPPAEGLEYRFLLQGPGTGSEWRDLSGWISRNSFTWRPEAADAGNSTITVEARSGRGLPDAQASISYEITAESSSDNELPVISSLSSTLGSPRGQGTKIEFICQANDADNDPIYYRFYLTGPGTANKKKLMQDWSHKNAWRWEPSKEDVGTSTIEVQIRDGQHAGIGSYDDSESITFVVSDNSLPAISSFSSSLSSPRSQGMEIEFICIATDADLDPIYYRFYLTGPGTANKKKLMQDWSQKNAWRWEPSKKDIGTSAIQVQIRDGQHAGIGSFDDSESIAFVVSDNSIPAVNSLYCNESGTHYVGDKVHIVANASDPDGDKLLFRFWIYRESVGVAWEQLTGWQEKNWLLYELDETDYGTITFKAQVRDGKHAGEESYDAEKTLALSVSRASLTSVTPSLSSPQAHENTIVFTAAANKTAGIYYRFWQKGPGTGNVWRDWTGWQQKNSWSWRTLACDVGSNQVKVQVCDDPDTWNDGDTTGRETTLNYTIS